MECTLSEKLAITSESIVDLTGGITGKRVDMSVGYRLGIVIDTVTAAADLVVDLEQHDAAAGGTSKALSISHVYYAKVGAETKFTKKDFIGSTITDATLNGAKGMVVVEVMAEELDRDNGFTHVSINFTQGAVARNAAVIYELHNLRSEPGYSQDLA